MEWAFPLDPSPSAPPLHRQLYRHWREGILAGHWAPGDPVPSSRELARALGLARGTVTRVYDDLVAEGYLQARAGARTRISSQLPERLLPLPTLPAAAAAPPIRLARWGAAVAAMPAAAGLGAGPDLSAFPRQAWARRIARLLRTHAAARLDYRSLDYRNDVAGDLDLRRELAGWLRRTRGVVCTPAQVLITNGSQQALDLALRLLLDRGDRAAMEDPGYPGARLALQAAGARIAPVPVDGDGLMPHRLPRAARLLYLTPSHQFPTGALLSLARRLEILAWARRTGAVVLEDDYDSELRYASHPVPALQGLAQDLPVLYMGTFSKILFPALRLGYLVAPAALMPALTAAKRVSDRETRGLEQMALAEFIRDGSLERHLRRTRTLYARRRAALLAVCRESGGRLRVQGDAAGMHVLLRVAGGLSDSALLRRAAACGLPLAGIRPYYAGRPPRGEFLLGFAQMDEVRLATALAAFARPARAAERSAAGRPR